MTRMKIKLLSSLLFLLLAGSMCAVSAKESKTDWTRATLPPTGYEPESNSSSSRRGKSLYDKHNCASCHQIKGQGGTMGPPLDGIGGHRGEEFLTARLENPLKQSIELSELFGGKPGLMPHPGLNKRQAGAIAKYLLTLPEPLEGFPVQAHEPGQSEPKKKLNTQTPASKLGAQLFLDYGCAACHTTYDDDPRFGPTLKGISQRKSREEIERLLSGKFKNKLMKKQAQVLDPQEVRCITDFLLKLPAGKKEKTN